jgi:hypothetical protein
LEDKEEFEPWQMGKGGRGRGRGRGEENTNPEVNKIHCV